MSPVYFNAFLYIIALLVHWYRTKRVDCAFVIWLTYALTAVMCVYNYSVTPEYWQDLSTIRFLYLFLIVTLCILPFSKLNITTYDVKIEETKVVKILTWIFIVSGIFVIYYTYTSAAELILESEWGDLRNEFYDDADNIELYSSSTERLMKNLNSYLAPLGMVMAFYALSKPKLNKMYVILLFVVWVLPVFLNATLTASRGRLAYLFIKLVICYTLFKNLIPTDRKRYLFILFAFIAILSTFYLIAVTESRFEEDAASSVYYYLGHSMLSFNDGIMNTMHTFTGGEYMFGWFIEKVSEVKAVSWMELGATHGTAFMTFVGGLYRDFGPFGTVVFATVYMSLMHLLTHSSRFELHHMILLVCFISYILDGVMVTGPGIALQWFMVCLVALIVKLSVKFKIG